MSDYPPEDELAHRSGEDEENDEEDAEDDEPAEWTDMTALEDLEGMADGPSTFFVGGYSACHHLGDAIDRVQYKEDLVVVFPGLYTEPRAEAAGQPLELDEARLGGLRVLAVDFARTQQGSAAAPPKYAAASKRRVGPWFTWLTAAATTNMLTQDGAADDGTAAGGALLKNPLQTAAARAMAATDGRGAKHSPSLAAPAAAAVATTNPTTPAMMTTTSGSSVFAAAITSTTSNAANFPVFDFPVSVVFTDARAASGGAPLRHYKQEADEEDGAGERDGDDGEAEGNAADPDDNDDNIGGSQGDQEGGAHGAGRGANSSAARKERAVTLAGCCARAGLTLGSLTRTVVQHCVVGSPDGSTTLRIALTAAPLCEALVEHCLVYGGASYGVYAFPRSALALQSCLVEGPNAEAAQCCGAQAVTAEAAAAAAARAVYGGSVIDQLEHHRARALRLRAFMERGEAAAEAAAAESDDGSGGSGSAYVDVEDGVLPRFTVPQTPPTCDVGVMCDDADVRIADCLVSHTRLGVLLHGGCAGAKVTGLDIRSCAEAGLYVYGAGGAAEVLCSAVRACGRACLLLIGPSATDAAQAAGAASGAQSTRASMDTDDDGTAAHVVMAQHPHLRSNTFIGAVRVQGDVLNGALVDNFVFLPREEKSAATVAAAAETLLAVEGTTARGFTYVGVEGERVAGKAAAQVPAY